LQNLPPGSIGRWYRGAATRHHPGGWRCLSSSVPRPRSTTKCTVRVIHCCSS